ncbi:LSR1 NADH:ubiquinone oxidoreductase, membrane subunit M [Candidatus Regiella insecticola 5.15]|uniref:LSR1 NADH:ubiquinone oxidoreductase, membrane subunit M n=1 Tax=Candidatus Regiella insecticola 5.15 TaxID=1005043 RepID=G2GYX9_9ENTR|nr:LSR1 NADH:ubiquinone oxidoreductase, membrane subunit M [Candidatus Regiella insecticola 5.15]
MAQAVFDTLKFVKILTAKGIPVEQAEAFSDAVLESHAASDVATKRDQEIHRHQHHFPKKKNKKRSIARKTPITAPRIHNKLRWKKPRLR